jgi:hypothetical protein
VVESDKIFWSDKFLSKLKSVKNKLGNRVTYFSIGGVVLAMGCFWASQKSVTKVDFSDQSLQSLPTIERIIAEEILHDRYEILKNRYRMLKRSVCNFFESVDFVFEHRPKIGEISGQQFFEHNRSLYEILKDSTILIFEKIDLLIES